MSRIFSSERKNGYGYLHGVRLKYFKYKREIERERKSIY